jgi:hypothetical protein
MEYQGDVTINGIARALYHSWVKSESAESHAPYLFEDTEKMNSLSHLRTSSNGGKNGRTAIACIRPPRPLNPQLRMVGRFHPHIPNPRTPGFPTSIPRQHNQTNSAHHPLLYPLVSSRERLSLRAVSSTLSGDRRLVKGSASAGMPSISNIDF